jgi:hypothetical protein
MTYAEMRERIRPERYEVIRRVSGTAKMSKGWPMVEWEEPHVWATIVQREPRRVIAADLSLNSMSLCIPEGPSGRWPRGVEATDEEIILAVVGDEPIFGKEGNA